MTDEELAKYLGIHGLTGWQAAIDRLTPKMRETFEHLHKVEHELNLWTAGLGPKPKGVIVCPRTKR